MTNSSPSITDWHHDALLSELETLYEAQSEIPGLRDIFLAHFGDSPEECLLHRLGGCARSRIYLILSAALGRTASPELHSDCLSIELLHQTSLIMDDMEDKASLRKKSPTVWSTFGDVSTIRFSSSLLFRNIHRIATHAKTNEAFRLFPHTGLKMLYGQGKDAQATWSRTFDTYREAAEGKTGRLYDFSARLACHNSEETRPDVLASVERLMLAAGVAHQICDDLVDAGTVESGRKVFLGDDDALMQNVRQSIFSVDSQPGESEPLNEFLSRQMPAAQNYLRVTQGQVEALLTQVRSALGSRLNEDQELLWNREFVPLVRSLGTRDNGL